MILLPSLLLAGLAALPGNPPVRGTDGMVRNYVKMDHLKLQTISNEPNAMVWIDVENVRGKSGFELSHMDLLEQATIWTKHHGLEGKVNLVVDHGTVTCGYWLKDRGLSVCFAGPRQKADDVISQDVSLFGTSIVVTADNELQQRCRRSARHSLHIMPPNKFLDDLDQTMSFQAGQEQLEKFVNQKEEEVTGQSNEEDEDIEMEGDERALLSSDDQILLGNMDAEIRLGGQLLEAQAMLFGKKTMTHKRKKKIEKRIQNIKDKLARKGPSTLDRVTALLSAPSSSIFNFVNGDGSDDMLQKEQNVILSRWLEIRNKSPRREQTGDRVILAERLRRHLIDSGEASKDMDSEEDNDEDGRFPVKAHVRHMNGYMSPAEIQTATSNSLIELRNRRKEMAAAAVASAPVISSLLSANDPSIASDSNPVKKGPSTTEVLLQSNATTSSLPTKTLTLVVVSDTHGFETQFADQERGSDILPDGDVLLHLGDFAMDGTHDRCFQGLIDFDAWLARQPHKYKIVIRGNHDPFKVDFAQSGAWYITKPKTVTIEDVVFALVPYGSSRKLAAEQGIPNQCDVFASHVPPFKDLDHCLTGRHAGSGFLTRIVHGMVAGGQPRLWLCGHIHEGRGVKLRRFGKGKDGRDTLVINAANANSGPAANLDHGPVVLKLDVTSASDESAVEIVEMHDQAIGRGAFVSQSKFFEAAPLSLDEDFREVLLAVDLGLKTGISMFNDRGKLMRYEQFHFETTERLEEAAIEIIQGWEDDANQRLAEAERERDVGVDVDSSHVALNSPMASNTHAPAPKWRVTHIAIEGADPGMREAWSNAAQCNGDDRPIALLNISPEEWRSHLLTKKERASGFDAKAAARLIARQVVADYGTMQVHQGKFQTDMAESVVMGIYVARKLGWVTREPAVRRYTNNGIVVPKSM
jgi:Icc-related predicted phosphoesterase